MQIKSNGQAFKKANHLTIMNRIANALDEIGFNLMASHVRQRYDEPSYKAYVSLIRHYVDKNPKKYYVIDQLGGLV